MTPRVPGGVRDDLPDGPRYPKTSHAVFLCVLPTSLVEATSLGHRFWMGWWGFAKRQQFSPKSCVLRDRGHTRT
eukprot:6817612-Pyramimonas_sp.AAC.1